LRLSFLLIHDDDGSIAPAQRATPDPDHVKPRLLGSDEWFLVATSNDANSRRRITHRRLDDICHAVGPVRPSRLGDALNAAAQRARGDAIVLLDRSEPPEPEALHAALDYLRCHTDCGMICGRTRAPDGEVHASGLPSLPGDGNAIIRPIALEQVGGFARGLGRVGRGYDLGLRLWRAGYRVERFEDLTFTRIQTDETSTPARRVAGLTEALTDRLIVADRYFPGELRTAYVEDWLTRYGATALQDGCPDVVAKAGRAARWWRWRHTAAGRQTLGRSVVEHVLKFDTHRDAIASWADRHRVCHAVVAGVAENLFAAYRSCEDTGVRVAGILSDQPAYVGTHYRGLQIRALAQDMEQADGVIIATMHPARILRQLDAVRRVFAGPVLRLWQPRRLAGLARPEVEAA